MKNSRKISLLLVLAMILISLVLPMSASAAEVATLLEDNFNSYETVDALKAKWGIDTNSSTTITPASIAKGTGADNSTAFQLNRTTGTDWIMKHFTTVIADEGVLKATLKIKNDYKVVDGVTQYFDTFIAFGSKNNNGKFLPALFISGGVLYTGQNSAKYGTKVCEMANGEWYDIEFTYDVATKDFAITVSKDGEECGTASLVPPQGVGSMTAVETMRIQLW